MNNRLFETLEFCLRDIEQGADVGVNLARHPDLAGELRPILEASVKAKAMAVPAPSGEVFRRNRAKLLQHAVEMRERKVAPPSRRIWSVPLRRALVMLAVVVLLFVSGTGLVRASSTSLPGDNLYPVKRIWERMSLWFTFDTAIREKLEYEHENERLEELSELLALGRSAKVDFAGYVTRQSLNEWRVSGITVFISFDTRLPNEQVVTGAAVRVRGQTVDGGVAAERVELLPPDSRLPEVEKDEYEAGQEEGANPQYGGGSGGSSGSGSSTPSHTPSSTPEPEKVSIEGTVTSIQNNLIVVNGIVMDIRSAEINGAPSLGALAKVEGYYNTSGIFIVTRIEFVMLPSGGDNINGNSNDDNSNDNDDDDDDDDDNNDND
jgi:hypothetical protein